MEKQLALARGVPAAKRLLPCALRFGCAFLFSGASIGTHYLPLGLCFTAASGPGLYGLSALLGLCFGTAVLRSGTEAAEMIVSAVLLYAVSWVFRESELRAHRTFLPCVAALDLLLTGCGILLIGSGERNAGWFLLLRIAFCPVVTLAIQSALSEPRQISLLFLTACLIFSAAPIRLLGYSVGILLAAGLTLYLAGSASGLLYAAVCGSVLDLIGAAFAPMTALLCLLSASTAFLAKRFRLLPVVSCVLLLLFGTLLTGWAGGRDFIPAACGALLSFLLPGRADAAAGNRPVRPKPAVLHMQEAADLLDELGERLRESLPEPARPEPSEIFDRTADRVCRACPSFPVCWAGENEAYSALSGAAAPMLERGVLLPDDLPVSFLSHCRRIELLLASVNQELDSVLYRRQFRYRLSESRKMLADEYRIFSSYLARTAAQLREEPRQRAVCTPVVGSASEGRRGSIVSGDHGAAFRVGRCAHYILLCDGMGSGEEAMRESSGCTELLRGLLCSGFSPEDALQLLGSTYLLRDDGAFSTVDLLYTDLATGKTALYKWGSAPSYIKTARGVKKIGTALPPPGLEGTGRAERIELSLGTGEMLVLLSDGADSPALEERIRRYPGSSPRELAAAIIEQGEDDDRMAVVMKLQPVCSRRQHTTSCA